MNWRALPAIVVGLLLPVPLVLLLGSVLLPSPPAPHPAGARVSPVLDTEERRRLVTYRRHCLNSSECEPPLGCLFHTRAGTHVCIDSQCMTDLQCPEGHVCRTLVTVGAGGPWVRFCEPVGVRQEGEGCVEIPDDQGAACGPGLLCVGKDGWCARPCRPGEPSSCPEGFFCADVAPEPACLPTCEGRACPEGQRCVRHAQGASSCAVVYGLDCQQAPCPQGRECELISEPLHPGKVWMGCVERCGEGFPPCTSGLICDGWQCLPPCDPDGPNVCAEGYRCIQRRRNLPWACQPDK
jgi:hypothetical protein